MTTNSGYYWTIGLEGLAALGLTILFVQDWRTRTVDWLLFPYLGVVFLSSRCLTDSMSMIIGTTVINFLLITIFVGALLLYQRIRFGAKPSDLFTYLGPADLLFWLVVSVYLTEVDFVTYFACSLIFSLLVFGVIRLLKRGLWLVPLAGLQAGYLLMWMIGSRFFPEEKAALTDWFLTS